MTKTVWTVVITLAVVAAIAGVIWAMKKPCGCGAARVAGADTLGAPVGGPSVVESSIATREPIASTLRDTGPIGVTTWTPRVGLLGSRTILQSATIGSAAGNPDDFGRDTTPPRFRRL